MIFPAINPFFRDVGQRMVLKCVPELGVPQMAMEIPSINGKWTGRSCFLMGIFQRSLWQYLSARSRTKPWWIVWDRKLGLHVGIVITSYKRGRGFTISHKIRCLFTVYDALVPIFYIQVYLIIRSSETLPPSNRFLFTVTVDICFIPHLPIKALPSLKMSFQPAPWFFHPLFSSPFKGQNQICHIFRLNV